LLTFKNSLAPLSLLLALALVVAAPVAQAQTPGDELEREAQNIDRMIMCPVCPAETIDQAQVEISFQMRAVVREMLAEGSTRGEILDYFVDRYGADILAAPPKSGTSLVAWILPIVGVAAGLAGVFLVIRAMTGRQRPIPASAAASPVVGHADEPAHQAADSELAPYLEIADRILSSRRAASRQTAAPGPASGEPTGTLSQQDPGGTVQDPSPEGETHG
jgi:cytochrome c-type biogenesis protein CcmH